MSDAALRALADEYWQAVLVNSPTYATFLGDHRYDDQLEDWSAEGDARDRETWAGLRHRLAAIEPASLDQADRVTHGLLQTELDNAIDGIDIDSKEQTWGQMSGVHAEYLSVIPQLQADSPESAAAFVVRFAKFETLLAQAADRFRAAVAKGRTPVRVVIERSLNTLDKYLASPLEQDPFVNAPGPADWDGDAAWRQELTAVVRDTVRPAFARYRDVLADELLAVARADEQPGLQWIPEGHEQYRTLVRRHTSLDLDPREVHEIGMRELTEKLPAEYAAVGQRLFGTTDQAEIFDRLRNDPALRYETADEIMADSHKGLAAAKAVMAEWFGRLPKAECELKPVPDFLAADAPGAYYYPPADDGSRGGTYFVNTHEPSQKTRFDTASVAYHEAIPGHHLQLAIANELEGFPDFQRLSMSHTAYAEGWGLYAERLADEMGLYTTDLDLMGMLTADSWRSCRLVVDTGMHALGWTRQQAIDFMHAHTPVSLEEVTVEIDRYIDIPGQALAYKVGQREIFRLRADAKDRLGGGFDIKGFHDTVLGSSLVTLPILGQLVDDWVGAASA
jgi:uncharacterized protein (DUF885 family)